MIRSTFVACGLVAGLTGLWGCAGGASVVVDTTVPAPLIEPLEINVGVFYNEELSSYVHLEDLDYYGKFRIDLGASQIPVFDRIFDSMFAGVTAVDAIGGAPEGIDAILAPSIEKLQFSIPAQTRSDFYEVWIKYKINLHEPDGTLIHSWDVAAYGKANQHNYGAMSAEKRPALGEATTWALRDAAAFVSFHFASQEEVRAWLEKRSS